MDFIAEVFFGENTKLISIQFRFERTSLELSELLRV